jgi:hypothetical protein
MDPSYGITGKLLVWFFAIVSIFYGTILVLYLNFQQVVQISERIVSKNYAVSDYSKKMFELLLSMEENGKKYRLLKKPDYATFFQEAQQEFEVSLANIIALEGRGQTLSPRWHEVNRAYQQYAQSDEKQSGAIVWIPEEDINAWLEHITAARKENELEVEETTRELNRQGRSSVRNALIGLGFQVSLACSVWSIWPIP